MRKELWLAGFVLGAAALGLTACLDFGDIIRVKTPFDVQSAEGLPARLSLNEAESAYQKWYNNVRTDAATWKASIERGNEVRGLLRQITLGVLDQIGPTLAGIPVLGPALPALTALIGIAAGRGRLRREKEDSHKHGRKSVIEDLLKMGVPIPNGILTGETSKNGKS